MTEDVTTDKMWITDTTPSSRFPVFTRMNAGDVLPNPISPLGASLAWLPHMLPGWAAGYAEAGAYRLSELLADESAAAGFFYGYLYINQSTVRTIGIRLGLGWEAIDTAFFAGAPTHRPTSPGPTTSTRRWRPRWARERSGR